MNELHKVDFSLKAKYMKHFDFEEIADKLCLSLALVSQPVLWRSGPSVLIEDGILRSLQFPAIMNVLFWTNYLLGFNNILLGDNSEVILQSFRFVFYNYY